MKKMLALFLSLAMLLSLAACGSGGDSSSSSSGEAAALSMQEDIQNYLAKVDQSYVEKIAETLAYAPPAATRSTLPRTSWPRRWLPSASQRWRRSPSPWTAGSSTMPP